MAPGLSLDCSLFRWVALSYQSKSPRNRKFSMSYWSSHGSFWSVVSALSFLFLKTILKETKVKWENCRFNALERPQFCSVNNLQQSHVCCFRFDSAFKHWLPVFLLAFAGARRKYWSSVRRMTEGKAEAAACFGLVTKRIRKIFRHFPKSKSWSEGLHLQLKRPSRVVLLAKGR